MMQKSRKQGRGEYIWPSGDRYVGEYKNCKRDGFGIYY